MCVVDLRNPVVVLHPAVGDDRCVLQDLPCGSAHRPGGASRTDAPGDALVRPGGEHGHPGAHNAHAHAGAQHAHRRHAGHQQWLHGQQEKLFIVALVAGGGRRLWTGRLCRFSWWRRKRRRLSHQTHHRGKYCSKQDNNHICSMNKMLSQDPNDCLTFISAESLELNKPLPSLNLKMRII